MVTPLFVLLARIRALVARHRLDADFDDEIATHLALLTDQHLRRGMTRDEAHRAAILAFGGAAQLKEQHREQRGLRIVDVTMQDLRYAVRSLRRSPGFATVAIVTLAVGIAAATAMFTVANAVLLRPLPYPEPERLVEISEVNPLKGWTHTVVAPANLADWRARNTRVTHIARHIRPHHRGARPHPPLPPPARGTPAPGG